MADSWVDLADAIEGLRAELTTAIDRGAAQGMHFRLSPIELTLTTVIKNEGDGKVGWKLLEVGGSRSSEVTQTLTLQLTPVWKMQDGTIAPDPLIAATITPAVEEARTDVADTGSSAGERVINSVEDERLAEDDA